MHSRFSLSLALQLTAACLLSSPALLAQSSSGTISGRVLDSTGNSVPGARITLTKQDTREVRMFSTPTSGEFTFASVQPGPYSLKVEAQGFKALEKTDLNLSASERLSAGDLALQIGTVSEVVKVTAEATPVQTTSSERSGLLDLHQVTNLFTPGRDVMGLLVTLPGVIKDDNGNNSLGTQGSPAAFSGTRSNYSSMNVDGVSATPRGGNNLDTPIASRK
jgi:hypothetical protein